MRRTRFSRTAGCKRADRSRGKFRDFLKTSLRNFVLDRLNRAEVRHAPVSLDELEVDVPAAAGPSEEFDLTWVRTVLAETLRRMEADCRDPAADQPRRGYIWEMFRIRLLEPIFNDAAQPPYEQLIERFGLQIPDRRLEHAPERQAHFQDAPEPGHQGIRRAGRRHGGGNPGPGGFRRAAGQANLNSQDVARKFVMDVEE